jgi:hypothetical protein
VLIDGAPLSVLSTSCGGGQGTAGLAQRNVPYMQVVRATKCRGRAVDARLTFDESFETLGRAGRWWALRDIEIENHTISEVDRLRLPGSAERCRGVSRRLASTTPNTAFSLARRALVRFTGRGYGRVGMRDRRRPACASW